VNHHLAQLNIARFRLPVKHSRNADFVNQLDHINAIAESHSGFIWRLTGDGNDALDVRAYDDPRVISNLSVWTDLESLAAFVYRNPEHKAIMRRRREWFETIETYQVLWWINKGLIPSLSEAQARLKHLKENGPSTFAFTFSTSMSPPAEDTQK